MNDNALACFSHLARRWLVVGLISMLSLVSVMTVAIQPSHAQIPMNSKEAHGQTKEQLTGRAKGEPLSPEERLDRAYSISEAAGMREEKRQAEGKFNPREENESVVEKLTDAISNVKGD
jgi:hypothetical protein